MRTRASGLRPNEQHVGLRAGDAETVADGGVGHVRQRLDGRRAVDAAQLHLNAEGQLLRRLFRRQLAGRASTPSSDALASLPSDPACGSYKP